MEFMKKTFVIIVVITAIVAAITGTVAFVGARVVSGMHIKNIDLSQIPNGVYKGEQKYLGFVTKVAVYVTRHRITRIDVSEARGGRYVEKAKKVTGKIIAKQSLDVDTITGATVTSKAIIKAVENALRTAQDKHKKFELNVNPAPKSTS